MAPIVQVENLSHIYSIGTPFEHVALDNMNFSVERGEYVQLWDDSEYRREEQEQQEFRFAEDDEYAD